MIKTVKISSYLFIGLFIVGCFKPYAPNMTVNKNSGITKKNNYQIIIAQTQSYLLKVQPDQAIKLLSKVYLAKLSQQDLIKIYKLYALAYAQKHNFLDSAYYNYLLFITNSDSKERNKSLNIMWNQLIDATSKKSASNYNNSLSDNFNAWLRFSIAYKKLANKSPWILNKTFKKYMHVNLWDAVYLPQSLKNNLRSYQVKPDRIKIIINPNQRNSDFLKGIFTTYYQSKPMSQSLQIVSDKYAMLDLPQNKSIAFIILAKKDTAYPVVQAPAIIAGFHKKGSLIPQVGLSYKQLGVIVAKQIKDANNKSINIIIMQNNNEEWQNRISAGIIETFQHESNTLSLLPKLNYEALSNKIKNKPNAIIILTGSYPKLITEVKVIRSTINNPIYFAYDIKNYLTMKSDFKASYSNVFVPYFNWQLNPKNKQSYLFRLGATSYKLLSNWKEIYLSNNWIINSKLGKIIFNNLNGQPILDWSTLAVLNQKQKNKK